VLNRCLTYNQHAAPLVWIKADVHQRRVGRRLFHQDAIFDLTTACRGPTRNDLSGTLLSIDHAKPWH
jgi:hypothetical protein